MIREQLQSLLHQRPFRVRLTDGRSYEVRYPYMNLLAQTYIKIGIPESEGPHPICDHTEYVPFKEIDRIEEINLSMRPPYR
jgi:hypothetical protein